MTTPDFDTLEAQIRAEADRRIAAAKALATARRTLLDAREEFARQDASNVAAFEKALAGARDAGFTDKALIDYKLADAADTARGRRSTATKARPPGKTSTRKSRRAAASDPFDDVVAPPRGPSQADTHDVPHPAPAGRS